MKFLLTNLLILFSFNAYAIDLREYFPASNVVTLKTIAGADNARYTFTVSPSGFSSIYNTHLTLNKAGYHYTWRKEYYKQGAWCTATYAILFMGDDQSVTEVGDWLSRTSSCTPDVIFGYKTASNVNTGLQWSPAGGLTATPAIIEMFTAAQATPGAAYQPNGYAAYSKTGLLEELPTYTPPYGRDSNGNWCAGCSKTYTDVIKIVMYHGTRNPTPNPVRCGHLSPISANGTYYHAFKDYNTYAMELYLAKGIGIIQESTPFIEDASYWGSFSNCSGGLFTGNYAWSKFIDLQ